MISLIIEIYSKQGNEYGYCNCHSITFTFNLFGQYIPFIHSFNRSYIIYILFKNLKRLKTTITPVNNDEKKCQ